MKTAIDTLLDAVQWEVLPPQVEGNAVDGLPHATHKGVLRIGDIALECYVLNTGQRIFAGDAIERFLEGLREGYGG